MHMYRQILLHSAHLHPRGSYIVNFADSSAAPRVDKFAQYCTSYHRKRDIACYFAELHRPVVENDLDSNPERRAWEVLRVLKLE